MAHFRCYACVDPITNRPPEFESDKPFCPHCGAQGASVPQLTYVHFLVKDPAGQIVGQHGWRYKVACEPKRQVLAVSVADTYAATGDPAAVSCPSCQGTKEWQERAKQIEAIRSFMALKNNVKGGSCC